MQQVPATGAGDLPGLTEGLHTTPMHRFSRPVAALARLLTESGRRLLQGA